jgi:hypothetical protein
MVSALDMWCCFTWILQVFWDFCPFTARFMVFANLLKFFAVLHIRISCCTMYRRRLKVSMFACFLSQSGFWSWFQNVCECSDCRKTKPGGGLLSTQIVPIWCSRIIKVGWAPVTLSAKLVARLITLEHKFYWSFKSHIQQKFNNINLMFLANWNHGGCMKRENLI